MYLFASLNEGKFAEALRVAKAFGIELVSPRSLSKGNPPSVEEGVTSYRENTLLKGRAFCTWSGLPSVADDSGLEVYALGGRPGVVTADYGGNDTDPELRVCMLLDEAGEVSPLRARFLSIVCLVRPDSADVVYSEGTIEGTLVREWTRVSPALPFSSIFVPDGESESLSDLVANGPYRSHRVRALEKLFGTISAPV